MEKTINNRFPVVQHPATCKYSSSWCLSCAVLHLQVRKRLIPSFPLPSPRVSIKRLFRAVILSLCHSLSFGIFQGTEAENEGEGDSRLPSQFRCLVKRKESDCAARFLLTDRRRADADQLLNDDLESGKAFHLNAPSGYFAQSPCNLPQLRRHWPSSCPNAV